MLELGLQDFLINPVFGVGDRICLIGAAADRSAFACGSNEARHKPVRRLSDFQIAIAQNAKLKVAVGLNEHDELSVGFIELKRMSIKVEHEREELDDCY